MKEAVPEKKLMSFQSNAQDKKICWATFTNCHFST